MSKQGDLRRDDSRIIIHFDYDAFYASVVEHEDESLKSVPLIIQQKQIVCTCNYRARDRGIYKLQLMTDALRICPDAVVILGEDLTRFRNASKMLYNFLRERIWSDRAERLGFDEVWLDCTDMIDYNSKLLNAHDRQNSFFCMDQHDPTVGFTFDSSILYGPTFPKHAHGVLEDDLVVRLKLASHLARHLRHELESRHGYTATVGIATNKTLSKLVGNMNKPRNQTTIVPPYEPVGSEVSTVAQFLDAHDIGKVPGIGFKLAQKIRGKILGRSALIDEGLVYGGTKEAISVGDVRKFPGMGYLILEETLGGPGAPKGIGGHVWDLLHGIDDAEVKLARRVPATISQEDSYMKYLHTFEDVRKQLHLLSERLIRRMRVDLTERDEGDKEVETEAKWLAHPKTLRLSTRPRPPRGPDGTRPRTFLRISKSTPLPNFVFSLSEPTAGLADQLVDGTLTPLFRRMHPEKSGWNLSLINLAVTNMVETASDSRTGEGRDIGRMFRRQEDVLKDFRVTEDLDDPTAQHSVSEQPQPEQLDWDSDTSEIMQDQETTSCPVCQAVLPKFAIDAHMQFHSMEGP
jgi:DNA polymerase iota